MPPMSKIRRARIAASAIARTRKARSPQYNPVPQLPTDMMQPANILSTNILLAFNNLADSDSENLEEEEEEEEEVTDYESEVDNLESFGRQLNAIHETIVHTTLTVYALQFQRL